MQTRYLVVDGVRSPVLIGGAKGTADATEAVLFAHGNPDAGGDWEPLLTRVAGFTKVVAPDMPGFGDADKRADQDYTAVRIRRPSGRFNRPARYRTSSHSRPRLRRPVRADLGGGPYRSRRQYDPDQHRCAA
jgi:pimeloyl-ACP methyl ester carboxylesterase